MDLVTFLRARLDEDEAVLRESLISGGGDYHACSDEGLHLDPDRASAEIGMKRRIMQHDQDWQVTLHSAIDGYGEAGCTGYRMAMEWTLRTVALPYSDHPDYDPEWKP